MDPDSDADPAIFFSGLQDINQKIIFLAKFFGLLLFDRVGKNPGFFFF
jgi:hypothetical protein